MADNHNIYDTIELIKKDLKTLEKAVYSNSSEFNNTTYCYQFYNCRLSCFMMR